MPNKTTTTTTTTIVTIIRICGIIFTGIASKNTELTLVIFTIFPSVIFLDYKRVYKKVGSWDGIIEIRVTFETYFPRDLKLDHFGRWCLMKHGHYHTKHDDFNIKF